TTCILVACGGDDGSPATSEPSDASHLDDGSSQGGGRPNSAPDSGVHEEPDALSDAAGFDIGNPSTEAAAADAKAPDPSSCRPMDLFLIVQASSSMNIATGAGPTRWMVVKTALEGTFARLGDAGISAGMELFGGYPDGGADCSWGDFETPDVPLAPLPGNRE